MDRIDIAHSVPGFAPEIRKPDTPEEAARQFERVLVKQMIGAMTKELFDGSLAGEDAPQWMGAYNDLQGDTLATELADQLAKSGRLGIAEMLLKQWDRQGFTPTGDGAAPADTINTEEPS